MTIILTHIEREGLTLTLRIAKVSLALLFISIFANIHYLQTALPQSSPWPSVATFWALVKEVGGSAQTEYTGCYGEVLIVYMRDVGALTQEAIVLTKDQNFCALLQTAFITGNQAKFIANLTSDAPLPAAEDIGAGGKLVYDIVRVCVHC